MLCASDGMVVACWTILKTSRDAEKINGFHSSNEAKFRMHDYIV